MVMLACSKSDSRRIPLTDGEKAEVQSYLQSLKGYSEANGQYMVNQSMVEASHTLLVWAADIWLMGAIGAVEVSDYFINRLSPSTLHDLFSAGESSVTDIKSFFNQLAELSEDQSEVWHARAYDREQMKADDRILEKAFLALKEEAFLESWLCQREVAALKKGHFETPGDDIERPRISIQPQTKMAPQSKSYGSYGAKAAAHVDGAKLGALLFMNKVKSPPARPGFRLAMQQAINNDKAHRLVAYETFSTAFEELLLSHCQNLPVPPQFTAQQIEEARGFFETNGSSARNEETEHKNRIQLIKDLATTEERLKVKTVADAELLRDRVYKHFFVAQAWAKDQQWIKAIESSEFEKADKAWQDYSKWLKDAFNLEATVMSEVFSKTLKRESYQNGVKVSHNLLMAAIHRDLRREYTVPMPTLCEDLDAAIDDVEDKEVHPSLDDKLEKLKEVLAVCGGENRN